MKKLTIDQIVSLLMEYKCSFTKYKFIEFHNDMQILFEFDDLNGDYRNEKFITTIEDVQEAGLRKFEIIMHNSELERRNIKLSKI